MTVTPEDYRSHRRTLNDVIARAAREGRISTGYPKDEHRYRHDGDGDADVSKEWDLVALERLRRAHGDNETLNILPGPGQPPPIDRVNVKTMPGRNAQGLFWYPAAALLPILGVIYPRTWVVEIAEAIARRDTGWSQRFRSDQYSGCGCEVVVTDPIDDVPALWRELETDRDALWGRIGELSGYNLATDVEPSGRPTRPLGSACWSPWVSSSKPNLQ